MAESPICGDCTVFIADENAPLKALGDTVNHCPKHAAADSLLAALDETALNLEALIRTVDEKLGLPTNSPSPRDDALAVIARARAVAAKARGGAA
jgi:hypothetical protein